MKAEDINCFKLQPLTTRDASTRPSIAATAATMQHYLTTAPRAVPDRCNCPVTKIT